VQPPQLEEKRFSSGTVSINYAEGPSHGEPLVLLHGLGRNWQDFLALIPALSVKWHIYAVDLRGHGKSERVSKSYTSSGYAADTFHLLTNVVCRPAVLFGHSLGGVVGMRIAAEHGDAVSALVVGDSVLSRETLLHSLYGRYLRGCTRSRCKEDRSRKWHPASGASKSQSPT